MSGGPQLLLSAVDRERLVREAAAACPEECCGILLGRRDAAGSDVVEEARPVPNSSSTDRRRGYVIDPLAVLAARSRGLEDGRQVVGFYHSHPGGGLRPSARDRAEAWPEASYLIVSPRGGVSCWRSRAGGAAIERVAVREPALAEDDS